MPTLEAPDEAKQLPPAELFERSMGRFDDLLLGFRKLDHENPNEAYALSYAVEALGNGLAQLREMHSQLQPCPEFPAFTTTDAVETKPTIRVRLQHSHTLKEGWRLSETTVEWTGEGHPDFKAIEAAQNGAFAIGANEARFRNHPQSTGDEDGGE